MNVVLQIHDGGSKESPILLILYGYWSEPFSVTSSSNHMWILFESDDSNTASGFRGHYTAIGWYSLLYEFCVWLFCLPITASPLSLFLCLIFNVLNPV